MAVEINVGKALDQFRVVKKMVCANVSANNSFQREDYRKEFKLKIADSNVFCNNGQYNDSEQYDKGKIFIYNNNLMIFDSLTSKGATCFEKGNSK